MDLKERSAGVEHRHPWEVARARSYRQLLAAHTDLAVVRSVLDIGAGDGWFASDIRSALAEPATIECWDINYRSEDLATPIGPGINRTAERPTGPFDVVLALDVLEHIACDETFLAEVIVPSIAPSGVGLLSVPAHPKLFSDHDRMLEHERRYRPSAFRALVGRYLDVVASGSLFSSLIPFRAIDLLRENTGRGVEQTGIGSWTSGPFLTRAVTTFLEADAAVGRAAARVGVPLPGLSTWAVVRAR
jgi:SAM-dependent methyltransferase